MTEKCSFIKTVDELKVINENIGKITSTGTESLNIFWKSDINTLEKILPPPLKPAAPLVIVYVCNTPYISTWKSYNEAGIIIPVLYNNKVYNYMLDIVISIGDDMPIFVGREILGFPKKMAEKITMHRNGNIVKVSLKRNGITFFKAKAEIGNFNTPEADAMFASALELGERPLSDNLVLTCDFQYHCNRLLFNNIKLNQYHSQSFVDSAEKAKITDITLTPSFDNPWAELEVLEPLGAIYSIESKNYLYAPTLLQKLYGNEYYKYLLGRYDSNQMGHLYRDYK